MAELKYEIVEKIGELGETGNGWKKELNLVSWNEREPVYDIRTWNESHDRMGKGMRSRRSKSCLKRRTSEEEGATLCCSFFKCAHMLRRETEK